MLPFNRKRIQAYIFNRLAGDQLARLLAWYFTPSAGDKRKVSYAEMRASNSAQRSRRRQALGRLGEKVQRENRRRKEHPLVRRAGIIARKLARGPIKTGIENRPTLRTAMKVFLTGATGFVGHHVARALAAEGADLRMLVRKTSNLKNLEGIPGDTHVGDLQRA